MYLIQQIIDKGEFEHQGHNWQLVADDLGWTLYRDGQTYRKYAVRNCVGDDINEDIGFTHEYFERERLIKCLQDLVDAFDTYDRRHQHSIDGYRAIEKAKELLKQLG